MPRKKNRSASTESSAKRSGGGAAWIPDWERITHAATTAATILIMGGLVAGLTIGRGPLQARAAHLRAGQQAPELKVVFQWPTIRAVAGGHDDRPGQAATWLDPITRAQLEELALRTISADPFDVASLTRAQQALMATGWFASRCTVSRDRDQVVHISGDWRTPFAVVRTAAGDRWVTYKGESLDKVFPEGGSGLCAITGIKADPPAKAGEVWEGGDVQAAIALLQYIRTAPGFDQVTGIDASDYLKRNKKQLAIITRYNSRIIWGGSAAQPLPGEWTSQAKLRQLAENLGRTGRLDAGQPQIDIRGIGGISFAGLDRDPSAPTPQPPGQGRSQR